MMAAALTNTQIAAALCEEVYRRADEDQQIKYNEGFGNIVPVNTELDQTIISGLQAKGFTLDNGFYYNNTTGFVGQIIQAGGKTYVVFRSSDLSGSWLDTAVPLFTGDLTGEPPVTGKKADPSDWANNRELNEGSIDRTQLTDALALLEAVRLNPATAH